MKKNFLITILLLTLSMLVLAACGNNTEQNTVNEAKNESTVVEVNIVANATGFSLYKAIAEANNLDEGLNIKVNWIEGMTKGPEIISAISGGSVNIGIIGDFPIVTNFGNDNNFFKVIAVTENTTDSALLVPADSDIQEIADLKGKTVGCRIGTGSQMQLMVSLDKAGLTTDDITMVDFTDGWGAALAGGSLDAMCVLKSDSIGNSEVGEVRILDQTDYALSSIIADPEWVEANPESAAEVLILLHRVWEYIDNNEDEAVEQILAVYPDAPEDRVRFILEITGGDSILKPIGEEPLARYDALKQFALDTDVIDVDFDIEAVYDNTYIELAQNLNK